MIIGGGKECTNGGECRGCKDIGLLNIGCRNDTSEFWVGQREKSLRWHIGVFGYSATLTHLLTNWDAGSVLDLWGRVVA